MQDKKKEGKKKKKGIYLNVVQVLFVLMLHGFEMQKFACIDGPDLILCIIFFTLLDLILLLVAFLIYLMYLKGVATSNATG